MDMSVIINEAIIKDFVIHFFIIIYTLKFNYKILNIKEETRKLPIYFLMTIIIDILILIIKSKTGTMIQIISLILVIALFFSKKINKNIGYSLMITMISFSVNYIMYLISVIITFGIFIFFKTNTFVTLIGIVIIYTILFKITYNMKKLKKGIMFLKKNEQNEYLGVLILNIATALIFSLTILSNIKINIAVIRTLFIYIIFFSIIMFITIQKSLQLYYKQKLQERETEEIKEELKDKNKEIEELQKENLKLNKINHSIAHKQKSLEYELNQLLGKVDVSDNLKNKVENLSKEMQKDTINVELTKTNINEIDNMLKYMQSECVKNKIDFELQINGNIHHMVNKYISKEDLEILLADHIKNAMIAIRHRDNINKSILVRLGIIDGLYSLYIYDSGIEFELETLINLGMKPSTTHKDDGGTGMGFMNTFDTLKKYNASIIIEEYGKPSKEKFTKVIKIIFDKENTYKISSYREKEIRKRDIEKRIEILK